MHYAVIVIAAGDKDIEEVLAPFNEESYYERNESDDEDEDVDDEDLDETEVEDKPETPAPEGCACDSKEGKTCSVCGSAEWDWYQLGGRYRQRLKIKEGCQGIVGDDSWTNKDSDRRSELWVDGAAFKDIDFDGMRSSKVDNSTKFYDAVWAAIHHSVPDLTIDGYKSFDVCKAEYGEDDRELLKEKFHGQPHRVAFHAGIEAPEILSIFAEFYGKEVTANSITFFIEFDDYMIDRDEFIAKAGEEFLPGFTVVKDGCWYHNVDNKYDSLERKKLHDLIMSCNPDDMVYVVDCHS